MNDYKLTESLISKLANVAYKLGDLTFLQLISSSDLIKIKKNSTKSLSKKTTELIQYSVGHEKIKQFRYMPPRVCPLCLRDRKHFQEFQRYDALYCPKHEVLIEEHCSKCHKALEFTPNLFRGLCTNSECHAPLMSNGNIQQYKSIVKSDIYRYVQIGQYVLGSQKGNYHLSLISDDGLFTCFHKGWDLLHDKQVLADFITSLTNYYCYSVPASFIKAILYDFIIPHGKEEHLISYDVDSVIRKFQPSLTSQCFSGAPILLQVNQFCSATGINRDLVEKLVNIGLLKQTEPERLNTDSIIDVHGFLKNLNTIELNTEHQSYISLKKFNSKNNGLTIDINFLTTAWLERKIEIRFKPLEDLPTSIFAKELELKHLIISNAKSFKGDLISLDQTKSALKASEIEVSDMLTEGKLSRVPQNDGSYLFRLEQVVNLMASKHIHKNQLTLGLTS